MEGSTFSPFLLGWVGTFLACRTPDDCLRQLTVILGRGENALLVVPQRFPAPFLYPLVEMLDCLVNKRSGDRPNFFVALYDGLEFDCSDLCNQLRFHL